MQEARLALAAQQAGYGGAGEVAAVAAVRGGAVCEAGGPPRVQHMLDREGGEC